jgi:hypothetical protein
LGGTGEVSMVSKQELDGVQAWDNHFGFFTFGYGYACQNLHLKVVKKMYVDLYVDENCNGSLKLDVCALVLLI